MAALPRHLRHLLTACCAALLAAGVPLHDAGDLPRTGSALGAPAAQGSGGTLATSAGAPPPGGGRRDPRFRMICHALGQT